MKDAETLRRAAFAVAAEESRPVQPAILEAAGLWEETARILAAYAIDLRYLVRLALGRLDFQDFVREMPEPQEAFGRLVELEARLKLPEEIRLSRRM